LIDFSGEARAASKPAWFGNRISETEFLKQDYSLANRLRSYRLETVSTAGREFSVTVTARTESASETKGVKRPVAENYQRRWL